MLHQLVGPRHQMYGVLLTTVLQRQTIAMYLTQQLIQQDFHLLLQEIAFIFTFLLILFQVILTQLHSIQNVFVQLRLTLMNCQIRQLFYLQKHKQTQVVIQIGIPGISGQQLYSQVTQELVISKFGLKQFMEALPVLT